MTTPENDEAMDAAISAALRQRPEFTPRVDMAHAAIALALGADRARASQRALAWSHGAWQAISAAAAATIILIVYCTWSVGLGAYLGEFTGRAAGYSQTLSSTSIYSQGTVTSAVAATGTSSGSSVWIIVALLLILLGAGLAWAFLAADDDLHGRFAIH